MSFEEAVSNLLESCPGVRGAAIVDPDGIPVVTNPRDASMEVLGAEFANIVRGVDQAGREFSHGRLQQFSVYAENAVVVLTPMAAGYFLLLVVDRSGLVGKARFLSRLTGERLYSEFV